MNFDQLLDLRDWWVAVVTQLLPLKISSDPCPAVELSRSNVFFRTSEDRLVSVDTPEALAEAVGTARTCTLLLHNDLFIRRRLTSTPLPYSRARDMAAADLIGQTPFRPDTIYTLPVAESDGSWTYLVVKKNFLDPHIDTLLSTRVTVSSVAIKPAGCDRLCLPHRSLREVFRGRERSTGRSLLYPILLGTLIAGSVLTLAHATLRYDNALSMLEADTEGKRQDAAKARAILNKKAATEMAISVAVRRKQEAVPAIRLWEELTARLPDDAWLTDVSVDDERLTISGFAQSAAGLIEPLDASALFSEPTFSAPVMRMPGQDGEHFEMRLKVNRE